MRAGKLRHVITFEHNVPVKSGYGEEVPSWVVLTTVRADVRDIESGNRYTSQHFRGVVTKQLFIRHIDGLRAGMRFSFGGEVYLIEPPIDRDGRGRMLEILAGVANG